DDAAGLAISSRMTSQINGLNQAVRNSNDAISLVQTADGALIETTNMLQRMRTLAVQAASDTNVSADRTALNTEFSNLRTEINRIANNTQWNGENVLDKSFASGSGAYSFQVGANSNQTVDLTIGNYSTQSTTQTTTSAVATTTAASGPSAAIGVKQVSTLTIAGTAKLGDTISVTVGNASYVHEVVAGAATTQSVTEIAAAIKTGLEADGLATSATAAANAGVLTFTALATAYGSNSFDIGTAAGGLLGGLANSSVTNAANANSAIAALDTAINTVNAGRSAMGATINVLQYAADNLANVSLNASASRSRVEDTDYSSATTELARTQIIAQAATAMLAQANQMPQTVLSLLK
ncbi:MAG TPA: flagellin, partial [Gammaproteobacteria bacterium]|nr:flagellin [Gammaproteobacteria bacterium]